jgi:hypothetical protein
LFQHTFVLLGAFPLQAASTVSTGLGVVRVWTLYGFGCCRLSDNEAKSQPAYKQEPVSLLPAGGAAMPMGEQVRKWLRLLRLEEAALHQDVKRHALAQACSKTQPINVIHEHMAFLNLRCLLLSVLFASVVNMACSNMHAL